MAINFPKQDDLPLGNPPLAEVICQVRFPPLLKIVEKLPAEFQQQVRKRFPVFGVRNPISIEVNPNGIPVSGQLPNDFEFKTPDGQTTASLGVSFVALSTQHYLGWTAFAKDLRLVFGAFTKAYRTVPPTRIGLRYINDLTYQNTSVTTREDLLGILNPDLLAILLNPSWTLPVGYSMRLLLEDGEERLSIRIGFESTPQPHVVLDYDYFSETGFSSDLTARQLSQAVSSYHRIIYNAFRWSIREDSVHIFQPKPSRR